MASRFRAVYRWLVPRWVNSGEGTLVLHAMTMLVDAFTERLRQGLEARFPSRGAESALALTGADRGIIRGRDETAAHYAQRLIAWRYPRGHRVRGSAYALLEQVSEYFGGALCWTLDTTGTTFTRTATGVESKTPATAPTTWYADAEWARFWLFIDGPSAGLTEHPDFGDAALWGGALGLEGYTVGQLGATVYDVQAIRRMLSGRAWKPAGTRAEWAVITSVSAPPSVAIDSTWEHWSHVVAGVQRPSRDPGSRYWSLSPELNNRYAGDETSWPAASQLVDGTTYAGNPASFPASVALPSGATYVGNPASYPVDILLVDDGDFTL